MVTAIAENVYHRYHGLVFKALWSALGFPFFLTPMDNHPLRHSKCTKCFSEHILSFSNHIPFNFNFSCLYNDASFLFADILTNLHDAEKWPVPYLIFPDFSGQNGAALFTAPSQNTLLWFPHAALYFAGYLCVLFPLNDTTLQGEETCIKLFLWQPMTQLRRLYLMGT